MSLPYELTTLPPQALEVLRFMGRSNLDTADADTLTGGAGLSEKGFSKAIKRLVTRGYMTMGQARVYHLTQKGISAIESLQNHDAIPQQEEDAEQKKIPYDLCAVVPAEISTTDNVTLQIGLAPSSTGLPPEDTQIVLRFEADGGEISPREALLKVTSAQVMAHTDVSLTAEDSQQQVRFRVEVFQLIGLDDLEVAGGMYIDLPVGNATDSVKAFHTPADLIGTGVMV